MEPRYYRYRDEARDAGKGGHPLFGKPLFAHRCNRLNPQVQNLAGSLFGKELLSRPIQSCARLNRIWPRKARFWF